MLAFCGSTICRTAGSRLVALMFTLLLSCCAAQSGAVRPSDSAGIDPNWQPKTADDFLARGYLLVERRQFARARADLERALELHPDWYMATFLYGLAAYDEKHYEMAIQDFNLSLRQNPGWPASYRFRGLSYAESGQHERAISDYQKAVELSRYTSVAYNDLGYSYRELGDFEKSKLYLDKAIEIDPDSTRARQNRAILFARQGNWPEERAELEIILHLQPKDQWAQDAQVAAEHNQLPAAKLPNGVDSVPKMISKVELSYTEEARRASVNAAILCRLTVNKDGHPENISVTRGAGFGLDENAMAAVRAWRFEPSVPPGERPAIPATIEVFFRLLDPGRDHEFARLEFTLPPGASRPELVRGKVPEGPGRGGDARLRVALEVGENGKPDNLSPVETNSPQWAEKALREMKDWRFRPSSVSGRPAAVKGTLELLYAPSGFLNFTVGQNPGAGAAIPGTDPNWRPKTTEEFLARGYFELRRRKWPEAEADAEEALRLTPTLPSALFLRGRTRYERKDYSRAVSDFDRAIEQKPDWSDVYRNRALAFSHSGQQARALDDFAKAIALNPTSAPSYNALGWAYVEMDKWDLAKENLDRAVELDPLFFTARENRAKLFAKQGDLAAERDELTTLLALLPSDRWAQETKDALPPKTR